MSDVEREALQKQVTHLRVLLEKSYNTLTCGIDKGYKAPHKKCRSCSNCKLALEIKEALK